MDIDRCANEDFERRMPGRVRALTTPDLKDAPLQKEFVYSLDEFQNKLIIVTLLSLVAVAIGIVGTYLSKSKQLQNMSFVALALNLNWLVGMLLTKRVKNELNRVHFSNLNGQTGFELLILFCQNQILLLIFLYLYALIMVRNVIIELKEMDVLSVKENGQLWESTYDQMPLQSVQAVLISFMVVQLLTLVAVLGYLFRFAQNGI